jgi:hypothetical protein
LHHPLIGCSCVFEAERHDLIAKDAIWCDESYFFFVFCDAPKSAPCELQQSRHNSHDVALETPTKQNMHITTYTLCGWNQGSNITQVHDGTHKRIYNNKDSNIQRSKSYIKQNSIRVRTRIQMGRRGLKITMASITLPRPRRKGNLANIVASMYMSSNLLWRKSETSSNKYKST